MTDKSDREKGPTQKQLVFCQHIVMGLGPSDAYRAAYGCERSKPETIATEAWRLLHDPHLTPIIEQMKQEAMNEAVTTRRTLLDRLEAVNKRAYEELTAEGAAVSPAAFRAFMDSYNELKGNVVDDRWEHIARAERSAQTDDVFDVFNERAWFR